MRVSAEIEDLRREPHANAAVDTQLLHGEDVIVYETRGGWSWLQSQCDDYVGYAPESSLQSAGEAPTHIVRTVRTFVYATRSIKSAALRALPMGARVTVMSFLGSFAEIDGGFVWAAHLADLNDYELDFVDVAERLLHAPYLWGGKSWLGIDCSGLVQLALSRAGRRAPRDTDMMEAELGQPIGPEFGALRRGDLVFWKGHVGIMQDAERVLHANGHHMFVASELLDDVCKRIERAGAGPITGIRRLS